MKRDMELIRTILLKVEADPRFDGSVNPTDAATLSITDYSNAEVIYHLVMLVEAGFLDGNTKMRSMGNVPIFKLTWAGHEFLDNVRDPEVWHKTKARVAATAGVALSVIAEIAKAEIMKRLGLP